ncbi:MAG: hypothetical protein CM1200mP24_09130 [Gammaproteobacteria bacterium]|nr:MAG: hypothetical protein CM1200mP24_09130 [Gammaproteobacteria bacterium]
MAETSDKSRTSRFVAWIDERIPLTDTLERHATKYYAPKNFNFWYYFGILATLMLVIQILTGIWLTMAYVPSGEGAFASVEYIMRDVEYGWLLRYLHSTGASFFSLWFTSICFGDSHMARTENRENYCGS